MKKDNLKLCKTCKWWKNEQAELDYRKNYGICICKRHKFNTNDGMDTCVLDRNNIKPTGTHTHMFENEQSFLNIESSQYCLVTSDDYGCINHQKK